MRRATGTQSCADCDATISANKLRCMACLQALIARTKAETLAPDATVEAVITEAAACENRAFMSRAEFNRMAVEALQKKTAPQEAPQ